MRFPILIASLSLAVFATACHDDEVCNPGLQLRDGVCVPIGAPAPDGGTSDGGTSDAATGDGGPADAPATD